MLNGILIKYLINKATLLVSNWNKKETRYKTLFVEADTNLLYLELFMKMSGLWVRNNIKLRIILCSHTKYKLKNKYNSFIYLSH